MFSYVDIVRAEIAIEAGDRFGISVSDEESDRWRTLGDLSRSVAGHAVGTTATEVFDWVRTLIAEGYGVSAELTPEDEVFADYDRMTAWFSAAPYPHRLGDRWFAKRQGEQSERL